MTLADVSIFFIFLLFRGRPGKGRRCPRRRGGVLLFKHGEGGRFLRRGGRMVHRVSRRRCAGGGNICFRGRNVHQVKKMRHCGPKKWTSSTLERQVVKRHILHAKGRDNARCLFGQSMHMFDREKLKGKIVSHKFPEQPLSSIPWCLGKHQGKPPKTPRIFTPFDPSENPLGKQRKIAETPKTPRNFLGEIRPPKK